MCGRQSFSVLIIAGIRERKRVERVGVAVFGAECLEFILHGFQFLVMFVARVVTLNVGNAGRGTETSHSVDMTIGVISCQP